MRCCFGVGPHAVVDEPVSPPKQARPGAGQQPEAKGVQATTSQLVAGPPAPAWLDDVDTSTKKDAALITLLAARDNEHHNAAFPPSGSTAETLPTQLNCVTLETMDAEALSVPSSPPLLPVLAVIPSNARASSFLVVQPDPNELLASPTDPPLRGPARGFGTVSEPNYTFRKGGTFLDDPAEPEDESPFGVHPLAGPQTGTTSSSWRFALHDPLQPHQQQHDRSPVLIHHQQNRHSRAGPNRGVVVRPATDEIIHEKPGTRGMGGLGPGEREASEQLLLPVQTALARNSNSELGQFFESLMVSMQLRFKVDAEMSTFRATMMPTSSGLIPRLSNMGFTTANGPTIPGGPVSGANARTDFRNAPGSFEIFGRTRGSSTACPSPPPSYGVRRNGAQALDNTQQRQQQHRGSSQGPAPSSLDARQQQQQHAQVALRNQLRPYLQGSEGSEGGQVGALSVHALHPGGRGGGGSAGGAVSESFPVGGAGTGTGEASLVSEDGERERERASYRRQRSNLHRMSSAKEHTAGAGAGAGLHRAGTERRLARKGTFGGPATLEEDEDPGNLQQQALAAGGEGANADLSYDQSPPGGSGVSMQRMAAAGSPQGVVAAALGTTSPESSCERAESGRDDSSGSLPVLMPHSPPAMGRSQSSAVPGAGVVSGLIAGSTGASPLTYSGHLRPIPELAAAEVHTGIEVSFGPPAVNAAVRPRMLRAVQMPHRQQQQQQQHEAGSLVGPSSSVEDPSVEPPVIDLFPNAQLLCEHRTLNSGQPHTSAQSPRLSGYPGAPTSTASPPHPDSDPAKQQMQGGPLRTSHDRGNGPSSNVTAKPPRGATHGLSRQGPGRSPTWYAGAPGVHPYPKRVLPEGPVELKLCCTPEELLKGVQELKPLRRQKQQEQEKPEQPQRQGNQLDGGRERERAAGEADREREWAMSRVEGVAAENGGVGSMRRPGARRASVGMLPADVAQRLASGAAPAVAGMVARSGSGSIAGGWKCVKEAEGQVAMTAAGDGGAAPSVLRSVTLEGRCKGTPVVVKVIAGPGLEPSNPALADALTAAAAVHPSLVRVYGMNLLPASMGARTAAEGAEAAPGAGMVPPVGSGVGVGAGGRKGSRLGHARQRGPQAEVAGAGGAAGGGGGGGGGAGGVSEAAAEALEALRLGPGDGALAVFMEACTMGSLDALMPWSSPEPFQPHLPSEPQGRGNGETPGHAEASSPRDAAHKGRLAPAHSPFCPSRNWPAYMARRALLCTALEIGTALAHLHDYGLVHGALTPHNVLRTAALNDKRGFCVKVSDVCLSLAALERHTAEATAAAAASTPTYQPATGPAPVSPAPVSPRSAAPGPDPGPPARPKQAFMPSPDAAPSSAPQPAAKEPLLHMPCSLALMRLPPQQQRLFVAPELYGSGNSAAAGGGTDGAGAPSRPMPSGASAAAAAAAAAATMSADRGVPTVAEEEDEEQDESEGQAQGHGQGTPAAAGPSPASDVYAFGGLLWAMAGGHTLLGAEELLDAPTDPGGVSLSSGAPRGPPAWPPGAHPHLQRLYEACTAADPSQRPTMDQVVAELTALDEGLRRERPRSRAAAAAAHAAVSNTRAHSGGPRGAAGATGSWMLPGVLG